jgi:hypothetical protein
MAVVGRIRQRPHGLRALLLRRSANDLPDACPHTLALLQAPVAAPLDVLIATLSSEIDNLPENFILVLEEYHTITGVEVPDLLSGLARHCPRLLHLVLISRRNPPLPLASLRAKGHLTEIRSRDLQFTTEEVAQYVTAVQGRPPSEGVIAQLERQTEGWIVGLHLATAALSQEASTTKGGNVTLYYDGKEVGKGRVAATQTIIFSADETTDIGYESGTPVTPDYASADSKFTGRIHWVQLDVGVDDHDHCIDPEERLRVAMARQ